MDNQQLKDAVRLLARWIVTDCIDHNETIYGDYWQCTRCWERTSDYDQRLDKLIPMEQARHHSLCITHQAKELLARLEQGE